MGKISLPDNFKAVLDDEVYCFRADTDRQAWFLAYQWSEGELLDSLEEINEYGQAVRTLMEKG